MRRLLTRSFQFVCIVVSLFFVVSCDTKQTDPDVSAGKQSLEGHILDALTAVGLASDALSVPKLGFPYSTPGRLVVIDRTMKDPISMIRLSEELHKSYSGKQTQSAEISQLLQSLDIHLSDHPRISSATDRVVSNPDKFLARVGIKQDTYNVLPEPVRALLAALLLIEERLVSAIGNPGSVELEAIKAHLANAISSVSRDKEERRFTVDAYHQIGIKTDIDELATLLMQVLSVVEETLPILTKGSTQLETIDLETSLGRVRIAGTGDDVHTGDFLLLIELGGNDVYENVGSSSVHPGNMAIVLDITGDDRVYWKDTPGPGAGVMGLGIWIDLEGNDRYVGRNLGLGAGLLGAGFFHDVSGDDLYKGGAFVQGMGQYGIGISVDSSGQDRYLAEMGSQGFGGTGGIGIQIDRSGNDQYNCSGGIPDEIEDRAKRHKGTHYLSMCQGYSFGKRPDISGGIGLLMDMRGNDYYHADIFAQGSSYWFALGMLLDVAGNDVYECFEHCQGESLHLGAGFLGDWAGNDEYSGYEHAQGVGIDRAVGILYDAEGNDRYHSDHESQGAGIKPFGVGMLIDKKGSDRYKARKASQGYSVRPSKKFPESQWPVGVLLDLQGKDIFSQLVPGEDASQGRVQNRQGVLVDKDNR
ncbi:MAG: hypothetical protein KAS48_09395 [Gammaproteobacteria bacterium]|nr:hypothetical protein [Gammaproteobacteria bacterium]